MLQIFPISALQDNYIWCLVNQKNAVVVDPGEAQPVLTFLKGKVLNLVAILLTHHHYDHTQGVDGLLNYKQVPVYGPSSISQVTTPLTSETLHLETIDKVFTIIKVPGHTLEHVAYYTPEIVLTGDTLFTAGSGKIFEGTPEQMYQSLCKLKALPDDTLVYCGHEYTQSNLRFAIEVEPNNQDIQARLQEVNQLRLQKLPTVPATIAIEKKTNPFLRCEQPSVISAVRKYQGAEINNPIEILKILREWKNTHKP